jgi:diguanylate cyclase (GGDEF)-like protein
MGIDDGNAKPSVGTELAQLKPLRVLLVSNDQQMLALLHSLLASKQQQYKLLRAKSLDQAARAIVKQVCDVVLLNYYWGKSRIGDKMLEWAKSKKIQIPIIVITKNAQTDIDNTAIKLGAADYLATQDLNSSSLDRAIRHAVERRSTIGQIKYLFNYDYLTNLPNRVLFRQRLAHAIRVAQRDEQLFALLIIDLKRFKEINEIYGHDVGDQFLQEITTRITQASGTHSSVARVGDNEFAVILSAINTRDDVQKVAEQLIARIIAKAHIKEYKLSVHCCIGIAIYPKTGDDAESLQGNAYIALSSLKDDLSENHLESGYRFYFSGMLKPNNYYTQVQQQFIDALANNQIGLYFNPRIHCASEQIVAVEVNPYWSHPEKGLLEYDDFPWEGLNNDITARFTEWLLATSFEYFTKLSISNTTKIVFNIEFQGLFSAAFPAIVEKHLARYNLAAQQLEFDLSKVAISKHSSVLEECMQTLSQRGVSFGINHFGSDELSLVYLQRLPISTFKLSQVFIEDMQSGNNNVVMTKALVDLAHSLGKSVVIEGLHSDLPISIIQQLGFDSYKSFFSVGALALDKMHDVIQAPALSKAAGATRLMPAPEDKSKN